MFNWLRTLVFEFFEIAGSTLQNIFMRYGYARGLTFAIPVKNWMYSFNEFFTASQVTTYTWNPQNTFDMMVHISKRNLPSGH